VHYPGLEKFFTRSVNYLSKEQERRRNRKIDLVNLLELVSPRTLLPGLYFRVRYVRLASW
jgi:hypothetical protein